MNARSHFSSSLRLLAATLLCLGVWMGLSPSVLAQRAVAVSAAEYYWDTDPGQGNGTALDAADGTFNSAIEALVKNGVTTPGVGLHKLFVRVRDQETSVWSAPYSYTVNVESPLSSARSLNLSVARYWWNNDTGNKQTLLAVDGNYDSAIELLFANGISTPGVGVQKFNVEVVDAETNVSPTYSVAVSVESALTTARNLNISQGEYFWNTDPGAGNGTALLAFDGNFDSAIEQAFANGVTTPGTGTHRLQVRFRDADGTWSSPFSTVVNVENALPLSGRDLNIASGVYYWDGNVASAQPLLAFDGNFDTAIETAFANGVAAPSAGLHKLSVRFTDAASAQSPEFHVMVNVENPLSAARNLAVTQAEFFWDTDPGQGNATPLLAVDGNFNSALEEALASGIAVPSAGKHKMGLRVKDAENAWSPVFTTLVNVEAPLSAARLLNITQGEYFWNTDPGAGNGTPLIAFDGSYNTALEEAFASGITTPGSGKQKIGIRFRDTEGTWSPAFTTLINVEQLLTAARSLRLTQGEYFWDTDPGAGNGTLLVASDGTFDAPQETLSQLIPTASLSTGKHILGVRTRDETGAWSPAFRTIVFTDPCTVDPSPIITASGPTNFCTGSVTLSTTSPNYSSFTWRRNNVVVGSAATLVVTEGGVYTVTVDSVGATCPGTSAEFIVAPQPTPVDHNQQVFAGNKTLRLSNTGYLSAPSISAYNGNFTGMTVESWVKLDNATGVRVIASRWDNLSAGNSQFTLFVNNGTLNFAVNNGVTAETAVSTGAILSPGRWYHVAATWQSNRAIRIYVNGQLAASGNQTGTGINLTSPLALTVGAQVQSELRPLVGVVDEFRWWSVARSADQIRESLYAQVAGTETGLLANFRLNEGSGNTAADNAPLANTASLNGGFSWENEGWADTVRFVAKTSAVCSGNPATLFVLKSQPGVSYQLRNASNVLIGSAQVGTGDTLTFVTGNLGISQTYNMLATLPGTSCERVLSVTRPVTVSSSPIASISPASNVAICQGSTATLSTPFNESYTYQWFRDGNPVVGATSSSLVTDTAGTYYVRISSAAGCTVNTPTRTVTVNARPQDHLAGTGIASNSLIFHLPFYNTEDDVSSNGLNGAPTGITYDYDDYGNPSDAANFTPGNSQINFGSVSQFDNRSELSFGAWVKRLGLPGSDPTDLATIFGKADLGTLGDQTFQLAYQGDGNSTMLRARLRVGSETYLAETFASFTPIFAWTHVMATWKSGDYLRLYINGNEVATSSDPITGTTVACSAPLMVGSSTTSFEDGFNGALDHVQIYNRQLTAAQVGSLATPGLVVRTAFGTVCTGGSDTITVQNAQSGFQYILRNNANDATISTLNGADAPLRFVVSPTSTTTYNILARNLAAVSCQQVLSVRPVVEVTTAPSLAISPSGSQTRCEGDAVVTLQATDIFGASYQWFRNGNPIVSDGGYEYEADTAGTYTVQATVNTCTVTGSNSTTVSYQRFPASAGTSVNVRNRQVLLDMPFERVIEDVSPYNNALTVSGATLVTPSAKGATALSVPRGSSVRAATVPTVDNQPTQISFGGWIRPADYGTGTNSTDIASIFTKTLYDGTNESFALYFQGDDNGGHVLRFSVRVLSNELPASENEVNTFPITFSNTVPASMVSLNSWNHLYVTWKSGEQVKLYINGQQVTQAGLGMGVLASSPGVPVILGATSQPDEDGFNGSLDECRLLAKGLTAAEVRELYLADSAQYLDAFLVTDNICRGTQTTFRINRSQSHVNYQLYNETAGLPVGSIQTGTGGTLNFSTSVLNAAGSFSIRAAHVSNPSCSLTIMPARPVNTQTLGLPSITSTDVNNVSVGTAVSIKGLRFTGATAVTFNGTAATYVVVDDTTITTTVPTGATTGPLVVTVGTCGSGSRAFTVNNAPVSATTLTTSPFAQTSYCAGSPGFVAFTANGAFNVGNTFTAQLSDASGSFASPVVIGTGSTLGSINATIPANTPVGTGYRIRVISSDPALVGSDNGQDLSITHLFTWTGAVNTDWFNPGNWTCGAIPGDSSDVEIPTGLTIYPSITTGTAICRSINIRTGATLSASGTSVFRIYRDFTNNGTFQATGGICEWAGTVAQATYGSGTFNFYSITINNTVGLYVNQNIYFAGNWTNNGGWYGGTYTVYANGSGIQNIGGSVATNFYGFYNSNSGGSSAGVRLTHTGGAYFYGNFYNGGYWYSGGYRVYFSGTGTQTVGGTVAPDWNDVTINNTSPGGVQLDVDVILRGDFFCPGVWTAGTRRIRLAGTVVQRINAAFGSTLHDLQIDNTVGVVLDEDLYLTGDLINNGQFDCNGKAVYFNGTVAQIIGGTVVTNFVTVFINNTVGLTLNQNIIISNTFSNLGRFNAGTYTCTFGGGANATLISRANCVFHHIVIDATTDLDIDDSLTLTGNITANGNLYSVFRRVRFQGTVLQQILGTGNVFFGDVYNYNLVGLSLGRSIVVRNNWYNYGPFVANGHTVTLEGSEGGQIYLFGSVPLRFHHVVIGVSTGVNLAQNIYVSGNWDNEGDLIPNTYTVYFNGTVLQTLSGTGVYNFYHLVINTGASLVLNANITLLGNFEDNGSFVGTGYTTTFASNVLQTIDCNSGGTRFGYLVIDSGAWVRLLDGIGIRNDFTNNGTFEPNGQLVLFDGSVLQDINSPNEVHFHHVTWANSAGVRLNTNLWVSGNWTHNGGFQHNGYIVRFSHTLAQQILGTAPTRFFHIYLNNTVSLTVNQNIYIEGTMTDTLGTFRGAGFTQFFDLGTNNSYDFYTQAGGSVFGTVHVLSGFLFGDGDVFIRGQFIIDADYDWSGTVTFNGTAAQTLGGTVSQLNFQNVVWDNPTTVTLLRPLICYGDWTNVRGFRPGGQTVTFSGEGSGFIVGAEVTQFDTLYLERFGPVRLQQNIRVRGNWYQAFEGLSPGTFTVFFNGTSPQFLRGDIATTFYNLVIDNNTTLGVHLRSDINILNNFTDNGRFFGTGFYTNFIRGGAQSIFCNSGGTRFGYLHIADSSSTTLEDAIGIHNGINVDGTLVPNGQQVLFDSAGVGNILITGAAANIRFHHIQVASGCSVQVARPLWISGNLTNYGGWYSVGQEVRFMGSSLQTIVNTRPANRFEFGGFWVATGATVNLAYPIRAEGLVRIDGTFQPAGSTFFCAGFNQSITGTGSNVVFDNLYILNGASVVLDHNIFIRGNWTVLGGWNAQTYLVTLNGTFKQNITLNSTLNLYGCTFNNAGGIQLDGGDLFINNTVNFTAGIVRILPGWSIRVQNPLSSAVTRTTGCVLGGRFFWEVNNPSGTYIFPWATENGVGKVLYRGYHISWPNGGTGATTLEVSHTNNSAPNQDFSSLITPDAGVRVDTTAPFYWTVDVQQPIVGSINVQLYGNDFTYVNASDFRVVCRQSGPVWTLNGSHGSSSYVPVPDSSLICTREGIIPTPDLSIVYAIGTNKSNLELFMWTGALSIDWNVTGNWSTNRLPTSTDNIIIAQRPNQPFITPPGAVMGSVVIEEGAIVTLPKNQVMTVHGNMTVDGEVSTAGGKLVLAGTTNQAIGGTDTLRITNLEVNNAAGAICNTHVEVSEILELVNGDLDANGLLTLTSNAQATGMVVNTNGVVLGNATLERYITPDLNNSWGYRQYSSPVQAAVIDSPNGVSDDMPLVLNTDYNTNPAATPFPNLFGYDESRLSATDGFTKGWFVPASRSVFQVGKGYTLNILANRKVDMKGVFNTGAIQIPVSNSLTPPVALNGDNKGWNLIGNPYPSPINWDNVTLPSGVGTTMYISRSTSRYGGVYGSYIQGDPDGIGTNDVTNVIPSMQGFFVRANPGINTDLTFTNAVRLTSFANPPFKNAVGNRPKVVMSLTTSNGKKDQAIVHFVQGAQPGYDGQYDAYNMQNNADGYPTFYSLAGSTAMDINGLPDLDRSEVIVPLGIQVASSGRHVFHADRILRFAATDEVWLEDVSTGTLTNLRVDSSYAFTMNAGSSTNRFFLRIRPNGITGTAKAVSQPQLSVFPNPASEQLQISLAGMEGIERSALSLTTMQGLELKTEVLTHHNSLAQTTLDISDLPAGVYLLRVQTPQGLLQQKVIKQ